MRQVGAVVVSAILMWAAYPPLEVGLLVFVAPAPFLWALRRAASAREAGWLGFLWGALFFGSMLSWIIVLGMVAWFPLTVVMGLWAAGYALLLFPARAWSAWRWWLVAIGGWSLMEWIRSVWPLGGFPWGAAGHAIAPLAWPRAASQWFGASGWTVLVIAVAAGLVLTLDDEHDRRPLELGVGVALFFSVLGALFVPDADGASIRVAVVQGNSPCPRVHCENEKVRIYSRHMALTSTWVPDGGADLVVWGEDSFGGDVNPTYSESTRNDMAAQAVRIGGTLIAGGTRPAEVGRFDNYNVVFGPSGQIVGEYKKRHPVPFGEFVPFRSLLEFVPQLDSVPNDMNRGEGPVVFPITTPTGSGFFGSVISFEAAFARTVRSEVQAGAQLLVVATNEGSYGRGSASDQLIAIVRMSAASLGVDVVHSAVTGRSAIIRADGSVAGQTELFTEDVLQGTVNLQNACRTVYAVSGDWLQVLSVLVAIGVAVNSMGGVARDFRIRARHRR